MIDVGKKKPFIERVSVGQNRVSAGVGTTPTMTYEQYFADESARLNKERQDAYKQAELYRERAAADAQASYAQNMSTYGVNAENMARMGLTGGGYSDYLNAQAYAQKRSDMQAADRNALNMEQQAQSTYASGMAALKKEQQAKDEYSNNAYTGLLADLQNPNVYGNYTEQGIRALGKQWGWDENKIQEAVDIWKATKDNSEISLDGEGSGASIVEDFSIDKVVSDMVNNGYVGDDGKLYGEQEFEDMLVYFQYNGADISDEEIEGLKGLYKTYLSFRNGKMTYKDFLKEVDAYKASRQTQTNGGQTDVGNGDKTEDRTAWYTVNNAKDIASTYVKPYCLAQDGNGNVVAVSVTAPAYKSSDFGNYVDTGKAGTKQEEYTQAIVDATKDKNSGLKEGDVVIMNCGAQARGDSYFVYLGNGVFAKLMNNAANLAVFNDGRLLTPNNLYVPNGYTVNGYRIEKSNTVKAS